ncbi:MAG: porin [Bradyrhizobiaceae bacterium]|nr:porin [Bradyrhizobiaceae bacterium]
MKSLLLGAAAGLVATAGAQAADLPVKAKPVEYVKICSAYGAGFYYIPGTDICLRVGGYVYLETGVKAFNAVANLYAGDNFTGHLPINADYNYNNWRASSRIILDARQNTAYGTLRAYLVAGAVNQNHGSAVGLDAAYLQFAGFTWGYTNSFFSFAAPGYGIVASPATDWSWINVFAYTAQLGNGLTASVSVEDERGRRASLNGLPNTTGPFGGAGVAGNGYGGSWAPDVVGNINVTQAWGRAQIMGAIHQVKPNSATQALGAGVESEWGWAIGAGIEVKTPQTGNPNNSFILQGAWTEGATDYTGYNSSPTAGATNIVLQKYNGLGPLVTVTDAFVNNSGSLTLTEAWSVYAGYRHYWTPMLRSSFHGGYVNIDEGADVNSQGELKVWQAGVSTVWSPVAGLDLSLDVVYSNVENSGNNVSANYGPAFTAKNDIWTAWTRIRRNF